MLDAWGPLADWIIQNIPCGIILIEGALGVGKTTLVQALSQKLGFVGPVLSPTYNLISFYPSIALLHGDFYRISDPRELAGLGLADYAQARVLLEWGSQFQKWLEPCQALIQIEYNAIRDRRIAHCSLL
jgi:tRNA threonylcarbamoyl adenosine modification protein YjeE